MRHRRDSRSDTQRTDRAHRNNQCDTRQTDGAHRDTVRTTRDTFHAIAETGTAQGDFMNDDRYLQAKDCEALTGIPAATWRYWAWAGNGPENFKLGNRRVWRESVIRAWIAEQEAATKRGGAA